MDLWFTTSIGADADAILVIGTGAPAHVLDMFCFGCPTDGASLNSLSSFSLPILLASDSVSCMSCSLDSSWYFDYSLLMWTELSRSLRSSISCTLIICSAAIFAIYQWLVC